LKVTEWDEKFDIQNQIESEVSPGQDVISSSLKQLNVMID